MIPKSSTETNFSLLLERVVQVLALCDASTNLVLSMTDIKKIFRLWYLVSPIRGGINELYLFSVMWNRKFQFKIKTIVNPHSHIT